MTPSLRSLIQFAALDRKLRQLSKTNSWQLRVWQAASKSLVEFEFRRLEVSSEAGSATRTQIEAALEVMRKVEKPLSELALSDLMQLGVGLLGRDPGLRRTERTPAVPGHSPLDPILVQQALERFLDWVRSQAFAEMHPVEQMTLCMIRLYEVSPFACLSDLISDLFAIMVLNRRSGLLPLFSDDDAQKFPAALSAAFGFDTKGLVELNAKACERTCDELLRQP